MTPPERDRVVSVLEEALAVARALPTATPCVKCDSWEPDGGFCGHWGSEVPTDVQPRGCQDWTMGVPF